MSTDTHSDDDIARCSSCGGEIPPEGSVAWEESDGDCPGHVATGSTVCGAFDPALPWDEEDDADESDEEEDDEPVDPRTGETLAAFTARHEAPEPVQSTAASGSLDPSPLSSRASAPIASATRAASFAAAGAKR